MSSTSSANVDAVPTIVFNTFKGGVSKTTTTYNLGWYFSNSRGIRTLVVDVDPQGNLSQIFLENSPPELKEVVFREAYPEDGSNLCSVGEALIEVLNNRPLEHVQINTYQHPQNKNLFLFAGSLSVTDYEESLATAESIAQPYTRDIPGALHHLIQRAARECGAQIVLIDTSPSMGCLNMVVVMSSDYFIIPCQADYFSLQAIKSARKRIAEVGVGDRGTWIARMKKLQDYTEKSKYPLPKRNSIFLGVLTQMFTIKRGTVTKLFKHYIDTIKIEITDNLVPVMAANNMTLPVDRYTAPIDPFMLAQVRNFNRFSPMAQEQGLPIIALLEHSDRFVNIAEDGRTIPLNGQMLKEAKAEVTKMVAPIREVGRWLLNDVLHIEGTIDDEPAQDDGDDDDSEDKDTAGDGVSAGSKRLRK